MSHQLLNTIKDTPIENIDATFNLYQDSKEVDKLFQIDKNLNETKVIAS